MADRMSAILRELRGLKRDGEAWQERLDDFEERITADIARNEEKRTVATDPPTVSTKRPDLLEL